MGCHCLSTRYFAKSAASKIYSLCCQIFPPLYTAWKGIVEEQRVQGVKVYDARLVALMNVYAIERILTFNAADFTRYTNIAALHPASI
jgi:predicted nucleic acid-binding protein